MKSASLIVVFLLLFHSIYANNDSIVVNKPAKKSIVLPVVIASACVGLGLVLDKPVHSFARDHQTTFLSSATDVTDALGEKTIMVPVLLTAFGSSFLLKDDKLKTTSWNAIKSVVMTSIVVEGLKISAGRSRPFTGEGNTSFHPFTGNDMYKSLPSGHASLAFAIVTPFAESYSRWLYVIPASVAAGRVWQQQHWLTDVMVGGGIGWLSGYLFSHSNKKVVVGPQGLVIWF